MTCYELSVNTQTTGLATQPVLISYKIERACPLLYNDVCSFTIYVYENCVHGFIQFLLSVAWKSVQWDCKQFVFYTRRPFVLAIASRRFITHHLRTPLPWTRRCSWLLAYHKNRTCTRVRTARIVVCARGLWLTSSSANPDELQSKNITVEFS